MKRPKMPFRPGRARRTKKEKDAEKFANKRIHKKKPQKESCCKTFSLNKIRQWTVRIEDISQTNVPIVN